MLRSMGTGSMLLGLSCVTVFLCALLSSRVAASLRGGAMSRRAAVRGCTPLGRLGCSNYDTHVHRTNGVIGPS